MPPLSVAGVVQPPCGGENRTVIAQFSPDARVFPEQLSVMMLNEPASGFVDPILPMTS